MSQSTLKLLINRPSTFVIIKNTSAPLYVRIATCSLTLSNSAGFLWAIYIIATKQKTNTVHIRLTIVYCMILPAWFQISSFSRHYLDKLSGVHRCHLHSRYFCRKLYSCWYICHFCTGTPRINNNEMLLALLLWSALVLNVLWRKHDL
jgi:hypothetical protein